MIYCVWFTALYLKQEKLHSIQSNSIQSSITFNVKVQQFDDNHIRISRKWIWSTWKMNTRHEPPRRTQDFVIGHWRALNETSVKTHLMFPSKFDGCHMSQTIDKRTHMKRILSVKLDSFCLVSQFTLPFESHKTEFRYDSCSSFFINRWTIRFCTANEFKKIHCQCWLGLSNFGWEHFFNF